MVLKFLTTLLLCVLASTTLAVEVHKWVDENGITHYSDEKPESDSVVTTVIEVPANYVTTDEENYYSILNQWDRLNQERLALKQLKLEKAKVESAANAESGSVVVRYDSDYERYFPVYPYYHSKKHHKYPRHKYKDFKFAPDRSNKYRSNSRRYQSRKDYSGLKLRYR